MTKANTAHPLQTVMALSIECLWLLVAVCYGIWGIFPIPAHMQPVFMDAQLISVLLAATVVIGTVGGIVQKKTLRAGRFYRVVMALAGGYIVALRLPYWWLFFPFAAVGFFLIIPYLLAWYSTHARLSLLREMTARDYASVLLTACCIALFIGVSLLYYSYRQIQSRSFTIVKVSPGIATYGVPVTLSGYHFGWKTNNKYRVMSNYGEIPSPWENERSITFSVPLHLREGAVRVWLEKPDESGRIVRSNNVNFTVVPFTALYPDEDDGFFQKAIKRIKRAILLNT